MSAFRVPTPTNEPVRSYAPGTADRHEILDALEELKSKPIDIPLIINGKAVTTAKKFKITAPHNHKLLLGSFCYGGEKEIKAAIDGAVAAQAEWAAMPWEHRAGIFLKAADLLATKYRYIINAAAMLAHSKNIFQAEIDAACELIDFWRYNVWYTEQLYSIQPDNQPGIWNRTDHRPLEGFIAAIAPFNFISINANLPTAPAIVGNVAVWKPSDTAAYTSYWLMKILQEAGLPNGVVNLIFADGPQFGKLVLADPRLAGVHFTGSTKTFQYIQKTIGTNIEKYKSYPRVVGETGGKDFIVAHKSADPEALTTAIVRGAFEYQGQKCSAASRCYIPSSVWKKIEKKLVAQVRELQVGVPEEFSNFVNAVIDQRAFKKISEYIDFAKKSKDATVIAGGEYDKSEGLFIQPTIIKTTKPNFKTMEEEIFGPVVTIYVYPDREWAKTLKLVDETSPYALTGAVFAQDRAAVVEAESYLRQAAGNFYINDKPTGAVVGQQPFGGARASGTNDKAGGIQNMIRWISPRSIKETFNPPTAYEYPFMQDT